MDYVVDEFADIQILRYNVEGFESLTLKQKTLIYYLSMAALEGRDILYDQNNKYNLLIRRIFEAIYQNFKGDRKNIDFIEFEVYLKRVWFSNGIHHHYGQEKFEVNFSQSFFEKEFDKLEDEVFVKIGVYDKPEAKLLILKILYDENFIRKKVVQTGDVVLESSNNLYSEGITTSEAKAFYDNLVKSNQNQNSTLSYGLNSQLVKTDDTIEEKIWKIGGMYDNAIRRIVYWLNKAKSASENTHQEKTIQLLIDYYLSGDLKIFDDYSINWVNDKSKVDFINGFIEVYGDAIGIKGTWEALVNFRDDKATNRTEIISNNAQWFENNSPINPQFRKEEVKGISAKVITVAQLGGDCYPATPIGINLPNSNWIRKEHGSKSVTIENIMKAYDEASKDSGLYEEFIKDKKTLELVKLYGFTTDILHTDLHECLGHGSGKILKSTPPNALGECHSTIEETRADLFGLYFMADDKIVELNLLPNKEAFKAEYYKFMLNGLMTQLARVEQGKNIEESHMQNRQLIAKWVLERGQKDNVVELCKTNGKTYLSINDYGKLRKLFAELLYEIQRITSEGDKEAASSLIEKYAVSVDKDMHKEVIERYSRLNLKPYKGFVNPTFDIIKNDKENIIDIKLNYTESFINQMLRYSNNFSYLPTFN